MVEGLPGYIVLLPQRYYVMTDLEMKSTLQHNRFRLVRTTGTKAGVFHPHPDTSTKAASLPGTHTPAAETWSQHRFHVLPCPGGSHWRKMSPLNGLCSDQNVKRSDGMPFDLEIAFPSGDSGASKIAPLTLPHPFFYSQTFSKKLLSSQHVSHLFYFPYKLTYLPWPLHRWKK